MLKIDAIAYKSKIANEHPLSKLLFGISTLIVCIAANSIASSALAIGVMALLTVYLSGVSPKKYVMFMSIPLGFLLLATATILISAYPAGHEVLIGITVGEMVYGADATAVLFALRLASRALGAVSAMYFISLNTPMNDLLRAFKRLHVPDIFLLIMEMIYRYIFVLLDEMRRMRNAQMSRLGYSGLRSKFKCLGILAASLFLRTYLRCDRVYAAMESRGYTGEIKLVKKEYVFHKLWILASVGLSVIIWGVGILERTWTP